MCSAEQKKQLALEQVQGAVLQFALFGVKVRYFVCVCVFNKN